MVDTKAVVTLSAWKLFQKHWESELKEMPETRDSFFANIRGLVTPYRVKYASEDQTVDRIERESIDITETEIVNWHYATVKYLITENPSEFISSDKIKIPKEFILTLRGFFGKMEIEDGEIITRFDDDFSD
jgi:hypothetical protein